MVLLAGNNFANKSDKEITKNQNRTPSRCSQYNIHQSQQRNNISSTVEHRPSFTQSSTHGTQIRVYHMSKQRSVIHVKPSSTQQKQTNLCMTHKRFPVVTCSDKQTSIITKSFCLPIGSSASCASCY